MALKGLMKRASERSGIKTDQAVKRQEVDKKEKQQPDEASEKPVISNVQVFELASKVYRAVQVLMEMITPQGEGKLAKKKKRVDEDSEPKKKSKKSKKSKKKEEEVVETPKKKKKKKSSDIEEAPKKKKKKKKSSDIEEAPKKKKKKKKSSDIEEAPKKKKKKKKSSDIEEAPKKKKKKSSNVKEAPHKRVKKAESDDNGGIVTMKYNPVALRHETDSLTDARLKKMYDVAHNVLPQFDKKYWDKERCRKTKCMSCKHGEKQQAKCWTRYRKAYGIEFFRKRNQSRISSRYKGKVTKEELDG